MIQVQIDLKGLHILLYVVLAKTFHLIVSRSGDAVYNRCIHKIRRKRLQPQNSGEIFAIMLLGRQISETRCSDLAGGSQPKSRWWTILPKRRYGSNSGQKKFTWPV
jgi:hypothetical protein